MTATTARLDAIEARAEGLTDLCAEHLRQSIRHVQRNCDIDCNIHEDETTWDDCKQPDRGDGDRMAAVLADIPDLLTLARKQAAALEAATNLIGELTEHDECSFDHHGGCQAHGYLELSPGAKCPQQDAKDWTARAALEASL